MIVNHDNTQLHLLDVLYWQDECAENKTRARDFDALSLRLESDAEFNANSGTVRAKGHDLVFVPKGCAYTRRCTVDKMIVFHFTMDPSPANSRIEVIPNQKYETLYPLFRKALTEWTEKTAGYYFRVSSILYRIFGEIYKLSEPDEMPKNALILRATGIIKNNYNEPSLSVSSLAAKLHVSEAYLRRIFHQELGQSPKQYIIAMRLERARELLNAGYDPISVIGEKVGFTDAKNFATAYKKYYGYPPSVQSYKLDEY